MKFQFRKVVFWISTVVFALHFLNLLAEPHSLVIVDCLMGLGIYLGLVWLIQSGRLDRFDPERGDH